VATHASPKDFRLGSAELAAIGTRAIARRYPKNTIIVSEGDSADGLFIMLEGRVKVFVSDAQGHEVILGTHGPGEYFGEMSLDTGPRSASVITLEPCQLLVVPKDAFREFIEDHPAFAFSLISKLIARVRTLTENVKSLALMDVYGRIARLAAGDRQPRRRLAGDGEPHHEGPHDGRLHHAVARGYRAAPQAAVELVAACVCCTAAFAALQNRT